MNFAELTDQSKTMLILVATWFLVLYPVMLYSRSASQVKRNPVYQQPLEYTIDSEGITVAQEEEAQTVDWEQIILIVETGTQYLFYSTRVHAFIFPKSSIGMEETEFNKRIHDLLGERKIRLKGAIKKHL